MARRLRTHVGGPTETFAALERSLATAFAALQPPPAASPRADETPADVFHSGFRDDRSQRGDTDGSTQARLSRRPGCGGTPAPKLLTRAPPTPPPTAAAAAGARAGSDEAGAPRESRAALQRRLPLLLEWVSALEKALHACFEGTLARTAPAGGAASFFTQNRKVHSLRVARVSMRYRIRDALKYTNQAALRNSRAFCSAGRVL